MEATHLTNITTTGGRGLKEIVPVLALHDGSEFGRQVSDQTCRELLPALGGAVVSESIGNALKGARRFFAPGFRQTLETPLWENQPVWAIWYVHGAGEIPHLLSKLGEIEAAYPRRFRHFLVGLVPPDPIEKIVSGTDSDLNLGKKFTHCLFFSEDRLAHDSLFPVVEGAAAFFRVSWERYCGQRDGNLSGAFHLTRDDKFFTLGCSTCRPDPEFHSERIGDEIARALCSRMLLPGSEPPPPESESLRKKISDYLDGSPVEVFDETDSESGLGLSTLRETVHLEYLPEARPQLFRSGNQRKQWNDDLLRLRNLEQTFTLLIEPSLEQRVKDRSLGIMNRQEEVLSLYLELPDSPHGLCHILQSRLNQVGELLETETATNVEKPEIPGNFQTDERRLRRSIDAVPERASIWLRAVMFLVGFAWLLLGSLSLAEQSPLPNQDPFPLLAITVILIVGIPAGILLRHFFVQGRAIRRFDTALANINTRHLWKLSRRVAEFIRGSAESLGKKFGRQGTNEGVRAEIDMIRTAIQKIQSTSPKCDKVNLAPFFSEASVDECVKKQLPRWTDTAWKYFRAELEKQSPKRDTIWPPAADWEQCLGNAARKAARDGLESIPIDEFTRSGGGDPAKRLRLFHDHSEEACTPYCAGTIPVDHAKIFLGPVEWYQYRGNHDDWEFHPSLDPYARFLVIMPINRTRPLSESCTF